jgi:hypothetical protein
MRRTVFAAIFAIACLPVATASAHKGSTAKARAYLAKSVRAADTAKRKTGKVKVSNCRTVGSTPRHRHRYSCHVNVELIYPDLSFKICTDRAVQVKYTARGRMLRVKSTYLNKRGHSCTNRLTPVPPGGVPGEGGTTGPDLPPPPVGGSGPSGPPGPPPLGAPLLRTTGTSPVIGRAATGTYTWLGYSPVFPWAAYPGYWFVVGQWNVDCRLPGASLGGLALTGSHHHVLYYADGGWHYWYHFWQIDQSAYNTAGISLYDPC